MKPTPDVPERVRQLLEQEKAGWPGPAPSEPNGKVLRCLRDIVAGKDDPDQFNKMMAHLGPHRVDSNGRPFLTISAYLKLIHETASKLLTGWMWNPDETEAMNAALRLTTRGAEKATKAHLVLWAYALDGIRGCGCVPTDILALMEALQGFAEKHGWVFEDGGVWVEKGGET